MDLIQATREHANWLISIGRKLRKLTPGAASRAVLAFLFAQLFFVLAFFLPLKAILLLATEGVPWYLSGVITAEGKDGFVLAIALAALASYGLHLLGNRIMERAVRSGAERIIRRTKKLHLFDDQSRFAREGYYRLCRVAGSVVIVILGFLLGAYLNLAVFLFLAVVVVVEYAVVAYLLRAGGRLGKALEEALRNRLNVAVGSLSGFSFLLGFAVLFAQFLAAEERNVIIAILSILLIRQVTQRIGIGVQDLVYLSRNRHRLNALFYSSIPYVSTAHNRNDAFLEAFRPPERDRWLRAALAPFAALPTSEIRSEWTDSNLEGVAFLEVDLSSGQGVAQSSPQDASRLFVAGYDERRARLAAHTLYLFEHMPEGVPCAPGYRGNVAVGKTRALLFDGVPADQPTREAWRSLALAARLRLWSVLPDPDLVGSYLRTHPIITARLGPSSFVRAGAAADTRTARRLLESFSSTWPAIRERIDGLPLALSNPALGPEVCRVGPEGIPWCLSWERWIIEPLGCDTWLLNLSVTELGEAIARFADSGSPLARASVPDMLVAAHLLELERALKRNRLRYALELMDASMAILEDDAAPELHGDATRHEDTDESDPGAAPVSAARPGRASF